MRGVGGGSRSATRASSGDLDSARHSVTSPYAAEAMGAGEGGDRSPVGSSSTARWSVMLASDLMQYAPMIASGYCIFVGCAHVAWASLPIVAGSQQLAGPG